MSDLLCGGDEVSTTLKERLLDSLKHPPANCFGVGVVGRDLVFDTCEQITRLEHENQKMRECIKGIIFSYSFMTGYGENEEFLRYGFRERLINANKLINGE